MSIPEVRIDGILYVPVSQAHIAVAAIEDAIVEDWAGKDWREQYPDAVNYLRVYVSDDAEEGMTVSEFAASVLAAAERNAK